MTVVVSRHARTPAPTGPGRRPFGALVQAYVALTKPRIIELLLITTLPVMFLAARGLPPLWPVVATLVGGMLSAGSANTLNCYFDRDIDAKMRRTRRRPLPMVQVSPRETLVFGITLAVLSTVFLGLAVNWVAAGLSVFAISFYVFVYTLLLKRRTKQNIVWGGIAGCMPVLIGWSALRGDLAWPPVVLFLVVFFWTPPHTWTLAMRYRDDYAAAGVPMLPVVVGDRRVAREVVAYTWVTVACSLALWPVAHTTIFYPIAAAALGAVCLVEAYRLLGRVRAGTTGALLKPMRYFHLSNTYLALLFLAVAIDPLLH